MITLRCRPLLRGIPACLRKVSTTGPLESPVVVKMPALSPTMADGGIVAWLKNEGEEITAGDGLCEIQTDKAVVTMEIEEDGVLAKILKSENSYGVKVGDVIAVIAEPGEDWRSVAVPDKASSSSKDVVENRTNDSLTPARKSPDAEYPPLRDLTGTGIGPAVRLLLELYHLRAIDITPTGPHGRLLKGDILAHIAQQKLSPQPPSDSPAPAIPATVPDPVVKAPPPPAATPKSLPPTPPPPPPLDLAHTDVPLSPEHSQQAQRASIGKRVVPHAYIRTDINLNRVLPRLGSESGVVEIVVKALANALQVVPMGNSFLAEDGTITSHQALNIAVVTSGSKIPCLVRNASALSSSEIGAILRQHADASQSNSDAENASFTVVDLSDTEVEHAAAIVTPPQAGAITIGGIQSVMALGQSEGQMERSSQITTTLSHDRRIMDETIGAELLSALKMSIEELVPIQRSSASSRPAEENADTDILGIGLD